jgi:hypothetical protein
MISILTIIKLDTILDTILDAQALPQVGYAHFRFSNKKTNCSPRRPPLATHRPDDFP